MLHQMAARFANDHEGEWPSDLTELAAYGMEKGVPEIQNWVSWPYTTGGTLRYIRPKCDAGDMVIVVVTPNYSVEGETRRLELTKGGRVHRL